MRVQLYVSVLRVAIKFSCVEFVLETTWVEEIESTQVNKFTTVKRNSILSNIVVVVLGNRWLEVNFKSNLTEIGHIPVS